MDKAVKESIEDQVTRVTELADQVEKLTGEELDVAVLLDSLATLGYVLAPIEGEHNISSLAYFTVLGLDVDGLLDR